PQSPRGSQGVSSPSSSSAPSIISCSAPKIFLNKSSFFSSSFFSTSAIRTDLSSSNPSTSLSINSAVTSSELNSTPSAFVSPSILGGINIPLGSTTYSLEPSSRVIAKITDTYGGLSLLPFATIPSCSSNPNKRFLSSIGTLWN